MGFCPGSCEKVLLHTSLKQQYSSIKLCMWVLCVDVAFLIVIVFCIFWETAVISVDLILKEIM